MKTPLRRLKNSLLLILLLMITAGWSNMAYSQCTVMTDKEDYWPGETVQITGTNWQPGEAVQLTLVHLDPIPSHDHESWFTWADSSGNISDTWLVTEQEFGTSFRLEALGIESECYAETFFTDGNSIKTVNISSQEGIICQNYDGTASYTVTVTASKNADAIALLCVTNLPVGSTYSFTPSSLTFTNANGDDSQESILEISGAFSSNISFTVRAFESPATCTSSGTPNLYAEGIGILNTIVDNTPPTVITQNIIAELGTNGIVSITPILIDNGSYDNCGIGSISVSPNTFTCANVGANTVTLTVTDENGNVSTANATVTVVDGIAPVALAQNVTVQLDAFGNGSTTAELVNNGSNDACGIATLVLSKTAFTCSDISTNPNPVILTVTDVNGNVSTANATVTVVDGIAPTVLTKNITIELDNTGIATITAEQINNESYDNCGIASMSVSPNTFGCSNLGPNTVILTVLDVNGNSATSTATVTVQNPISITYTGATIQATYPATTTANVEFVAIVDNLEGCAITPGCITFTTNPAIGTDPIVGQYIYNIPGTTKYRISVIAPVNIGTEPFVIYDVVAVASCYFNGYSETAVLTVYKPNGDMVTGGGYIVPFESGGTYASTPNEKANFGFNVKSKPTGIQGDVNYKFERESREYQIKATSFTSLGVVIDQAFGIKIAEFTAVATLSSSKPPAVNIPGLTLKVTLTDNGELGYNDEIGFTLWDQNNSLVYSSWWYDDYYTKELPLGGGNLLVHKGLMQADEVVEGDIPASPLSETPLTVYPNPTNDQTTFRFVPGTDCKAKLEIYSITGTLKEVLFDANVSSGQLYEIKYRPELRNSALLLYRLILDDKVTAGKLIFQK